MFVNECCETKFAQFTTITGILDSAEWKFRQRCPSGVNKGHTGFNLSSHFTGMVQIAGEYGSAKAIRGIISQGNGFCLILYLIYFAYRSEYFLVVKRIILINTSNDGRHYEIAWMVNRLVAIFNNGAVSYCHFNRLKYIFLGLCGRQRCQRSGWIHRVAPLSLGEYFYQISYETIIILFCNDETLGRSAYLACVEETGKIHNGLNFIHIGIIKNNECIIAAQFQRRLLEAASCFFRNGSTATFRTCQAGSGNALVGNSSGYLFIGNEEVLECAFFYTGFAYQIFKGNCGTRAAGSMLEQHRIAGNEVRCKYTHNLIEREVPWFYSENHTDGLLDVISFAGSGFQYLRLQEFIRLVRIIVCNVRAEQNFALGFANQLAHILSDDFCVFVYIATKQVSHLVQLCLAFVQIVFTTPFFVQCMTGGNCLFQFCIRMICIFLKCFISKWINCLVSHVYLSFT